MRYVLPACAAGALLSLWILPSAPLHDQWAWIVWGRELVHLDLDASAGPAWKPLPVLINAVLSLFGSAAPNLWLAVARFGGLLSLVMGFRLAARFAGWPAGVVTLIALLSAWLRNVSLGIAEGLLVALLLWAIERHLDGKRAHALVLGFAAGLIRPEVWPFLGLYVVFLWVREPKLRVLSAVLLVLTPILWFAPDALLAGEPLRSTEEAEAATTSVSASDVLRTTYELVPLTVQLAALAAVLLAWRRKEWAPVVLGAGAVAYVVVDERAPRLLRGPRRRDRRDGRLEAGASVRRARVRVPGPGAGRRLAPRRPHPADRLARATAGDRLPRQPARGAADRVRGAARPAREHPQGEVQADRRGGPVGGARRLPGNPRRRRYFVVITMSPSTIAAMHAASAIVASTP